MIQQETKKRSSSVPLLLVFVCSGHFCVDFMLGIWPVFKTMLQLDLAKAGLLASLCVLLGEGLQGMFGSLSDRGHQKVLLVVGIAIAAFATLFSYVDSYSAFFLFFLGTCLGSAAFHPTASSILGGLDTKRKSSVMGLFTAAGMLGLGVSQMLFSATYQAFDGSTALLAIPSLLIGCMALFFLRVPKSSLAVPRSMFPYAALFRFLKIRTLRILYLVMLGNQVAVWSLAFLLPDFLQARAYPSWIVYGGGHLFVMMGAALFPPIIGYVADHRSVKSVVSALIVLSLLLFYTLLGVPLLSQELLFLLLFMLGAVLGSLPPILWSFGNQLMPTNRGLISAFLMGFVWIVSESLGLGLTGYIATLFTDDAPAKALACMGLVLIPATYFAFQIPKTREVVPLQTGPIGETT